MSENSRRLALLAPASGSESYSSTETEQANGTSAPALGLALTGNESASASGLVLTVQACFAKAATGAIEGRPETRISKRNARRLPFGKPLEDSADGWVRPVRTNEWCRAERMRAPPTANCGAAAAVVALLAAMQAGDAGKLGRG